MNIEAKNKSYVLITPAYNEEDNLPRLAESIINQNLKPVMWVIVNDGSSDATGTIVDELAAQHEFIHAVHVDPASKKGLYYAKKIHAFNAGYAYLEKQDIDYLCLGNLDADISMPADYYDNVVSTFAANNDLGVAAGSYRYSDGVSKVQWSGNYVPGSILMSRRACYEQVDGYRALKYGAEDTLLCIMAEQYGWRVQYLPQFQVVQHRVVGTAEDTSFVEARYRQGLSEQNVGYSMPYALGKFVRGAFLHKPYFFGSFCRFAGYVAGFFQADDGLVPPETKKFLRHKQLVQMKLKPNKANPHSQS
ncbi:MAG: glycosyltransferase family A protein [Pseudomonadota bacterium]|nr:glycosyltransferase family A protein [Pseudomonadota bacterium]